jgi:hypothetical protein
VLLLHAYRTLDLKRGFIKKRFFSQKKRFLSRRHVFKYLLLFRLFTVRGKSVVLGRVQGSKGPCVEARIQCVDMG